MATTAQKTAPNGQIRTYPAPPQLATPTDLAPEDVRAVVEAVNPLIADAFALYVKTKNFHWHLSGSHFRDYHLLFDEQADTLLAGIDPLAERVRKIGGTTMRSIGHIGQTQMIADDNEEFVAPGEMIQRLLADNRHIAAAQRAAHRRVRRPPRYADRQPAPGDPGRDRAAHLVPLRGCPRTRQHQVGAATDGVHGRGTVACPGGAAPRPRRTGASRRAGPPLTRGIVRAGRQPDTPPSPTTRKPRPHQPPRTRIAPPPASRERPPREASRPPHGRGRYRRRRRDR